MDIEVLRNYAEIIESGSITAAAKKLYTAQATLSMQLKSLEKELGTVLLIRTAHRLELTEAGKMLYRRAKSITAIEGQLRNEIRELENGSEGTVRIAVSDGEGLSVCGDVLSDFSRLYPKIRVEIFERPDHEVIAMTEEGSAAMAFVRTPCTISADMNVLSFEEEPMAAVYDPERFSFGEEPLRTVGLSGKRIAVQRRYRQMFESTFIERLKKNRSEPPVVSFAADSAGSVLSAAEQGLGIGILPVSAAETSKNVKVKLIDEPLFHTQRMIVSGKNAFLSAAERKLLEYAQALFDR